MSSIFRCKCNRREKSYSVCQLDFPLHCRSGTLKGDPTLQENLNDKTRHHPLGSEDERKSMFGSRSISLYNLLK